MDIVITLLIIVIASGVFSLGSGKRSEKSHYSKTVGDLSFNRQKQET